MDNAYFDFSSSLYFTFMGSESNPNPTNVVTLVMDRIW